MIYYFVSIRNLTWSNSREKRKICWIMSSTELLNSDVIEVQGGHGPQQKFRQGGLCSWMYLVLICLFLFSFLLLPTDFLQMARNMNHHALQALYFAQRESALSFFYVIFKNLRLYHLYWPHLGKFAISGTNEMWLGV